MLFKYSISLLIFYLLEKSVNNRGMLKIYFDHKFVDSVNFCLTYFKACFGGGSCNLELLHLSGEECSSIM